MIIPQIIKLLQSHKFYGAGQYTEFAKGKYEYVTTFKEGANKIKRAWQSQRKSK
jgi:hypothetical protein